MTRTADPKSFTLQLVVLDDDSRPAAVRLRQLLKFALRALRLRCIHVVPDRRGTE
jgi:hypothetical protein